MFVMVQLQVKCSTIRLCQTFQEQSDTTQALIHEFNTAFTRCSLHNFSRHKIQMSVYFHFNIFVNAKNASFEFCSLLTDDDLIIPRCWASNVSATEPSPREQEHIDIFLDFVEFSFYLMRTLFSGWILYWCYFRYVSTTLTMTCISSSE